MDRLLQHSYPGNVRELENMVKRMIVLNDPHLSRTTPSQGKSDGDGNGVPESREVQALSLKDIARKAALAAERDAISKMLQETHWNRVKAAKLLNISYRALLYKIKNVGLEPERASLRSGEGQGAGR